MINSNNNSPIQAFPITPETLVADSGITDHPVSDNLIVHMNADGNITCVYDNGVTQTTVAFVATGGSDFAISRYFSTITVDASCIISKA